MENSTQLASRFSEVILNGTWISNTNYKDQLLNSDWKTVTTQIGSFNTIAALAQHIHYYINGMNHAFKNGTLEIKDKYSFDFPPIESQQQWDDFLERFWNDSEAFISHVKQMTDSKLNEAFIDVKYGTYSRNIDAMIEHSYYHLGQITLLKKWMLNK